MKYNKALKIFAFVVILFSVFLSHAAVFAADTAEGTTPGATATEESSEPRCTLELGSGFIKLDDLSKSAQACGPRLLGEYISLLNKFFLRLAIALAVLMIMVGGFQWLMAIGNQSRISNAKDTIQQAVVGLILALTATLLFQQIDASFVNLGLPDTLENLKEKGIQCDHNFNANFCRQAKDRNCIWECDDKDLMPDPDKGTWLPDKQKQNEYLLCDGKCRRNIPRTQEDLEDEIARCAQYYDNEDECEENDCHYCEAARRCFHAPAQDC